MRGSAFLRPCALRLGRDIFGESDQLLTALPVVGGIFRAQGRDAELGIFFLQCLPNRKENLTKLRLREAIAFSLSLASIWPLKSAAPLRLAAFAVVEAIKLA